MVVAVKNAHTHVCKHTHANTHKQTHTGKSHQIPGVVNIFAQDCHSLRRGAKINAKLLKANFHRIGPPRGGASLQQQLNDAIPLLDPRWLNVERQPLHGRKATEETTHVQGTEPHIPQHRLLKSYRSAGRFHQVLGLQKAHGQSSTFRWRGSKACCTCHLKIKHLVERH